MQIHSGTFVFIGQELLWKEQRIQMKYSFKPSEYAKYRPDLLGSNFLQQSLKDYNGQVYWLSFNINAFKKTSLPDWLNVALDMVLMVCTMVTLPKKEHRENFTLV